MWPRKRRRRPMLEVQNHPSKVQNWVQNRVRTGSKTGSNTGSEPRQNRAGNNPPHPLRAFALWAQAQHVGEPKSRAVAVAGHLWARSPKSASRLASGQSLPNGMQLPHKFPHPARLNLTAGRRDDPRRAAHAPTMSRLPIPAGLGASAQCRRSPPVGRGPGGRLPPRTCQDHGQFFRPRDAQPVRLGINPAEQGASHG